MSGASPGASAMQRLVGAMADQEIQQQEMGTHQIKERFSFQVERLDPCSQRHNFLVQSAVVLHGLL